jgi:hypothetical protein
MRASNAKASVPVSPESGSGFGRADLLVVLLLLALGAFAVAAVQTAESYQTDGSAYMVLARSIRETGRYEFNYKPHTVHPPGLPLLLAGISVLSGGGSYGVFIRFMPVFGTLALVVWYLVLKRDQGRAPAGVCCLLVAASGPLFRLVTRSILSDASYFFLSGLALWCLMTLDGRAAPRRPVRHLLRICLCLAAVLMVLLRTAGIALCAALLAWVVTEAWRRGWRRTGVLPSAAVATLAGFLAFFCWIGWTRHSERRDYQGQHMSSYASQFMTKDPHRPELGTASAGDLVVRLAANIPVQASHLAALATRIEYVMPLWYSPLVIAVVLLLLGGVVSCAADTRRMLLAWYFLAYFAVYLLWPFDEGPRFMLPVAPLAFLLMWRGILLAARLLRDRPAAALGGVAALSAALAVAAAAAGRVPGLQARASLVFWPLLAAASLCLAFLAGRVGPTLSSSVNRLVSWRAHYAVVGVLIGAGLLQQAAAARTNLARNAAPGWYQNPADCSSWLRAAPAGIVMAQQSVMIHRLSGRRVVSLPITSDPAIIVATVRRESVRYVVVNDEWDYEYFLPSEEERWRRVERAHPSLFRLVHRGPDYRVFEFTQAAP